MEQLDPSRLRALPGRPTPLGATPGEGGVYFAIFGGPATRVWLAVFQTHDAGSPVWEYELSSERDRVGGVWCVFVEGVAEGALYAYRMNGPDDPRHQYDPKRRLIDPYAKAVVGDIPVGNGKSVVVKQSPARPRTRPGIPLSHTVIYETHVRGVTVDASSESKSPGTYRGLKDKIPYLKELGVTTVELLPIQECGEGVLDRFDPATGDALVNYWGYNPIAFMAPTGRYAAAPETAGQVAEFRDLVDALHKAGLEVILDVVFNHTAEDRGHKPALGFRGIDHGAYYLLDEAGDPIDQTGCGNTVNCNHPVMRDLVVQSLRHWVTEYGIDGFRFDLAAILHRNRWGSLLEYSPLVERIDEDPVLRDTKLIAEPWDLAGGHLVGTFGGARWCEWNGRYRDDVRRFWRSDDGTKDEFALRITGSPDLYQERGRTPHNSINFVTAHDGFTLRDLVSYESKHNEANGEDNRDGENHNFSLNCGVEGPTDDPAINTIRLRMQKNHLATLLVSLGVPMLLGGDEFGRTQRGNNNAYCQDNAISWFDWSLLEKNWGLFRFCRGMLAFRMENGVFSRDEYFTGRPNNDADSEDLLWFNAAGAAQDWQPGDRTLACRIHPSENDGVALYLMFNPSEKSATFRLPKGHWRVRVDTSRTSPDDIIAAGEARRVPHRRKYLVEDRSLAILADWG